MCEQPACDPSVADVESLPTTCCGPAEYIHGGDYYQVAGYCGGGGGSLCGVGMCSNVKATLRAVQMSDMMELCLLLVVTVWCRDTGSSSLNCMSSGCAAVVDSDMCS